MCCRALICLALLPDRPHDTPSSLRVCPFCCTLWDVILFLLYWFISFALQTVASGSCRDRCQDVHHKCAAGDGQFGRVLHLSRSAGRAITNVEETTDALREQSLLEAGKSKHMYRLPRGFGDEDSESEDSESDEVGHPEPGASEGEMIGAVGVSAEGQVKLYELEDLPSSALLTVCPPQAVVAQIIGRLQVHNVSVSRAPHPQNGPTHKKY